MRSPGRMIVWLPLLVGGVVATVLAGGRGRQLRRWLDMLHPATAAGGSLRSPRRFELLRQAVIGNDAATIRSVFGPPPTTASQSHSAQTWYYPIDPVEQYAMVVHLRNGIAHHASFIQAPQALW